MWHTHHITEGKVYRWKLGNLDLAVQRSGKAWHIEEKSLDAPELSTRFQEEAPGAEGFHKPVTIFTEKAQSLHILPALPDKPVIIRPRNPLRVMPGTGLPLYLFMPVWVQIYSGGKSGEHVLHEAASRPLSNTWFGDPDTGFPAYVLKDQVHLDYDESLHHSSQVACTVSIFNDSQVVLDLQRMSIGVPQLQVFLEGERLAANEVRLRFKGEDQISDVHYTRKPGISPGNFQKINVPRSPETKGIIRKSFHFMRNITQY